MLDYPGGPNAITRPAKGEEGGRREPDRIQPNIAGFEVEGKGL